jgi:hypothetical protein
MHDENIIKLILCTFTNRIFFDDHQMYCIISVILNRGNMLPEVNMDAV